MNASGVQMPNRDSPLALARARYDLEKKAERKAASGKFKEALAAAEEEIRLIKAFESSQGRAVHKGQAYYLRGQIAIFLQKNALLSSEAVKMFLLAYAEDTLNVPMTMESQADRAPAGQWLKNLGIEEIILEAVRNVSRDAKRNGQWIVAMDTESLLASALSSLTDVDGNNLAAHCSTKHIAIKKKDFVLPLHPERSIFLGGPYKTHDSLIRDLAEIVLEYNESSDVKFVPVVGFEYAIQEDRIHDDTLKLLKSCRYAIFDVSFEAGQLMEIEKTLDYGTKTLLIAATGSLGKISAMVMTCGHELELYEGSDDIKQIVRQFLDDAKKSMR